LPILTYHKLGPRPRGARLKGLYLSVELFSRQLAELREAAFKSVDLDFLNSSGRNEKTGHVIVTFDDGFESVLKYGIAPLHEHGFRAIQFIVADRIGQQNDWDVPMGEVPERLMSKEQIRDWLAAGHQIGSHSLTHPFLSRLSAEQARQEIGASKKKLEDMFGIDVRHFCYPYGDWNPLVRDLTEAAGYKTACTTEFGVHTPAESPYALKRITARYASRNWKMVRNWCSRWFTKKA
jgi:peptidoglycan/xylan/chitin deacetylase (PgdA/CDA1 family)